MGWFERKLVQWKAKKKYFKADITSCLDKESSIGKYCLMHTYNQQIRRGKGKNKPVILSTDVAMEE